LHSGAKHGLPDAAWDEDLGLSGYFSIKKKLASASCLFSIVIKDYTLGSTNQYYVRELLLMQFSVGNHAPAYRKNGKNQLMMASARSHKGSIARQIAPDTVSFSRNTNRKSRMTSVSPIRFGFQGVSAPFANVSGTAQTDLMRKMYQDFIRQIQIMQLDAKFAHDKAVNGITRPYSAEQVMRIRPSLMQEYTLARVGAERLRSLLDERDYVHALGALTGNQAVQQVKAGLEAIYLSGWQVAADANKAGEMYPDQSLYPSDSVPEVVRKVNNALRRADEIHNAEGKNDTYWYAPIVADAEAGFGGNLNAFVMMQKMIEAGAAGVHFEDQLSSAKKCGHMGGKVLIPTREAINHLVAARLAADVMGVPTVLVARTDALGANLITSDIDPVDQQFLTGERTEEGFYKMREGEGEGLKRAIARGLAFAPYADLLWFETSKPDLAQAEAFAKAIHEKFPGKKLAYNCSPSFNWEKNLDKQTIAEFQQRLGKLGYKFQFVTLAGFHALNHSMFQLANGYRDHGMAAYSQLQQAEFAAEPQGYTAAKHQREVGTGYFDTLEGIITGGKSSTTALKGSTEAAQFHPEGGHA
jgi:isocitrate lyase